MYKKYTFRRDIDLKVTLNDDVGDGENKTVVMQHFKRGAHLSLEVFPDDEGCIQVLFEDGDHARFPGDAIEEVIDTDQLIKEMQDNSNDFFDQVAGEALDRLHKMYGKSLSQRDINRVIEQLEAEKIHFPER